MRTMETRRKREMSVDLLLEQFKDFSGKKTIIDASQLPEDLSPIPHNNVGWEPMTLFLGEKKKEAFRLDFQVKWGKLTIIASPSANVYSVWFDGQFRGGQHASNWSEICWNVIEPATEETVKNWPVISPREK